MSDRAWIVLPHDDQALPILAAPCTSCGATITDLVPISGITTLGGHDVPWSGTVHRCNACGAMTSPKVRTPRRTGHHYGP